MQHPLDRTPFVPLPFPTLLLVAAAVPLFSTFFAAFVTMAVVQVLDGVSFAAVAKRLAQPEGRDAYDDLIKEAADVVFAITILAATVILSTRRGSQFLAIQLAWTPWWKDRSFLPFLAVMFAWQAVDELVVQPTIVASAELSHLPAGSPALLVSLLSAAALTPLAQELFFRGFVYTNLRAQSGATVTITITAVLYAFMNLDESLAASLVTLPLGLIAGVARERYGSVRPAIYLHAIWNIVAWGAGYFGAAPA